MATGNLDGFGQYFWSTDHGPSLTLCRSLGSSRHRGGGIGHIYVARSVALTKWGADVGLGKNFFKIGVVPATADIPGALQPGLCGETDWIVVMECDGADASEEPVIERLQKKEKMIGSGPLSQAQGSTRHLQVKQDNVENHILVKKALEGQEPKELKLKPGDFAGYLIHNAIG